jgi:hypothetical protein
MLINAANISEDDRSSPARLGTTTTPQPSNDHTGHHSQPSIRQRFNQWLLVNTTGNLL